MSGEIYEEVGGMYEGVVFVMWGRLFGWGGCFLVI